MREADIANKRYLDRYTMSPTPSTKRATSSTSRAPPSFPKAWRKPPAGSPRKSNLDLKVWDEKRLAKEGYNGLIQVGRGSSHPPRMIRLAIGRRRRNCIWPSSAKGITFDTGGISIKPADKMWEMKGDMSGGAAVLTP